MRWATFREVCYEELMPRVLPPKRIDQTVTPVLFSMVHTVEEGDHGKRLDVFLRSRYRKRSRENLKQAIQDGIVEITRPSERHTPLGRIKPATVLFAGDQIKVETARNPEPPVSFDYRILEDDGEIVVVDKPANLPVHPAGRFYLHTLLIHLKTQGRMKHVSADREFFLAHRIDKDTSGVLVLTRDGELCGKIAAQFRDRSTLKKYLAIVHGAPPASFKVDAPMGRSRTSLVRIKMALRPLNDGGLEALTEFRTLKTHGPFSLVECTPKTGRQHQIRLHLASAGYPIVGDKLYSIEDHEAVRFFDNTPAHASHDRILSVFDRYERTSAELQAKLILPRHALHAHSLEFDHPVSGKRLSFVSPFPDDLVRFFDSLRG